MSISLFHIENLRVIQVADYTNNLKNVKSKMADKKWPTSEITKDVDISLSFEFEGFWVTE